MPDHTENIPGYSEVPTEFTLVAQGEVGAEDRNVIEAILGKYGMANVAFIPTQEYESARIEVERREPSPFKFTDVTHPDDFIVREHIENLQFTKPQYGKGRVMHAFHSLIDRDRGSNGLHDGSRNIKPRRGVHPVLREEVDLPPYPYPLEREGKGEPLSKYAVRAGDVIDAAEFLQKKTHTNKTESIIIKIADELSAQFES